MKQNETRRRERPAAARRPPSPPRASSLSADLGTNASHGTIVHLEVGPAEIPEHLFRRLLGAYLAGAREFVLVERPSISPNTREVVRSFCRRTRQPEIVSDEGGVLCLRDLTFESPVSIQQRIGRMGRMVLEVHREAVRSWQHLPLGEDGQWERRDDEVDREAWYIQRIASLGLTLDRPDPQLLGAWTAARSLERIADHAIVLGTVGPRLVELPNGAGPATSLRQFHAQAMDHLEGILGATDPEAVNGLLDTGEALMASGHALADRLLPAVGGGTMPPATAAAVARILESIGRTIAYAQDIAQVVLDRPSADLPADAPRDTLLAPAAP